MISSKRKGIGGHHRGFRGRSDVWLTPPEIVKALGPFDLDPCAPSPRPWDTADNHFSENGLLLPWAGRVWMNPPYGPELAGWLRRLAYHGNGIAIAFARTETKAFFDWVWPIASGILFIKGRLHFHRVDGARAEANAGGPSVLISYGATNSKCLRDCEIHGKFVYLNRNLP